MYDLKNIPLLASLMAKGITTAAVAATAFAPDVTEHLVSALDYAKFKEFLIKTHPGDLNHDLDKLIKSALIRAVGFIRRLYLDRLKANRN